MSSARQAVHRADSFTGFGKRPDLTPIHQLVLPRGITLKTCGNRKKPVSGMSYISNVSLHFRYDQYTIAAWLCPNENGSDSQFAIVARWNWQAQKPNVRLRRCNHLRNISTNWWATGVVV